MIVVLASASPRRIELLKMIGITDFSVIPSHIDEALPVSELSVPRSPEETVCLLALSKAEAVAPEAAALAAEAAGLDPAGAAVAASGSSETADTLPLIIAADTLVYLDGAPLGKPRDASEAAQMLRALSGRRHSVYTGVVLLSSENSRSFCEKSDVFFRKLSDDEISRYVATGEPLDKAGAYGAQGLSAMFIERIEGDFWNVVGLPLCRLSVELREFTSNL